MARKPPAEEFDIESLPEKFVYQGREVTRTGRKAVNKNTGSVLIEVYPTSDIGEPVKTWAPLKDLFYIE